LSGLLVMTSELLEGVPLSERLDLGPLPLEEAIRITRQALDALAASHEAGIVHREICPANLWITPDGTVKLTGFSRAKTASDAHLTQAGTAVGPVKYISPEQVKGTVDPDPRSDLYSLGVVLYELATGKVPFDSPSQFDVMLAHVSQTPMPPRHHKEDLPAAFDAIVLRAMAKDPAQRYQSAEEFDDALAAFEDGEPAPEAVVAPEPKPAPAPPPAAEMPAAAPVIARRSGLPTLTTAALMFLGAFLVLLVLMSLR
jgi:serine/threonine-protein kinase